MGNPEKSTKNEDADPGLEALLIDLERPLNGYGGDVRKSAKALRDAIYSGELWSNRDGQHVWHVEFRDGRRWSVTVEPMEPDEGYE
jgi:hypothetical protein